MQCRERFFIGCSATLERRHAYVSESLATYRSLPLAARTSASGFGAVVPENVFTLCKGMVVVFGQSLSQISMTANC
jgi:hypothetical protein